MHRIAHLPCSVPDSGRKEATRTVGAAGGRPGKKVTFASGTGSPKGKSLAHVKGKDDIFLAVFIDRTGMESYADMLRANGNAVLRWHLLLYVCAHMRPHAPAPSGRKMTRSLALASKAKGNKGGDGEDTDVAVATGEAPGTCEPVSQIVAHNQLHVHVEPLLKCSSRC